MQTLSALLDTRNDGFWRFSEAGTLKWNACGARCLNIGAVKLPWWWYRDVRYPGLKLIVLNNALAYREDGLTDVGSDTSDEDWTPKYGHVWTSDGCVVEECMRAGSPEPRIGNEALSGIRNRAISVKGTHFYLGWLSENYGHFLLESLSYLWPLLLTETDTAGMGLAGFVMEGSRLENKDTGRIPQFLSHAFEQFSIELSEVYLIREPVVFERLVVPTPSFYMRRYSYSTPAQAKVWAAIQPNFGNAAESAVYLSRRKYRLGNRTRRPLLNELEVENLFRHYGFEVVYPETLSFQEQLLLLGSSSVIAGTSGSNMHNSAFLPDNAKVLIIAPASFVTLADYLINAPKSIVTNYYFANVDHVRFDSEEPWEVDLDDLETSLTKGNLIG